MIQVLTPTPAGGREFLSRNCLGSRGTAIGKLIQWLAMGYKGALPCFIVGQLCRAPRVEEWSLHPLQITVQPQLFPPQACCLQPRPRAVPESAPDKLTHRLVLRPGKASPGGIFWGWLKCSLSWSCRFSSSWPLSLFHDSCQFDVMWHFPHLLELCSKKASTSFPLSLCIFMTSYEKTTSAHHWGRVAVSNRGGK